MIRSECDPVTRRLRPHLSLSSTPDALKLDIHGIPTGGLNQFELILLARTLRCLFSALQSIMFVCRISAWASSIGTNQLDLLRLQHRYMNAIGPVCRLGHENRVDTIW
jgi:hypothetical protein